MTAEPPDYGSAVRQAHAESSTGPRMRCASLFERDLDTHFLMNLRNRPVPCLQ